MPRRSALKPRKRPRQERSRFTVELILQAAARLFSRQGVAKTTTNHIARRAGVSIGSLYQYFPNKEAILAALAEAHLEEASALLGRIFAGALQGDQSIEQLLRRFVEAMLELHLRDPGLQRVLIHEAPRTRETSARLHAMEDTMVAAVAQLLTARGSAPARHTRHAAYVIVRVVGTLVHEFVVHPPEAMTRQELVEELVTMLRAYVEQPCQGISPVAT